MELKFHQISLIKKSYKNDFRHFHKVLEGKQRFRCIIHYFILLLYFVVCLKSKHFVVLSLNCGAVSGDALVRFLVSVGYLDCLAQTADISRQCCIIITKLVSIVVMLLQSCMHCCTNVSLCICSVFALHCHKTQITVCSLCLEKVHCCQTH